MRHSEGIEALPLDNRAGYVPGLDGIRALAVAVVIGAHFGWGNIIPGGFGVTVFFFLSGFLITRLLLVEAHNTGTIRIGAFYARRFARLMPALYVFVVLSSVLFWLTGRAPALPELAATLLYYQNYYNIVFFTNGPGEPIFAILWSLAIEEHFYLLFPLAMRTGLQQVLRFTWVVVSLLFLGAMLRSLTYLTGLVGEVYTYHATEMRIDSILFGVLLALLVEQEANLRLIQRYLLHPAPVLIGFSLVVLSFLIRDEAFRATWRYTFQGLGLTPCFAAIIFAPKAQWLRNGLELGALRYLGKISYPLYLWHAVVLALVVEVGGRVGMPFPWSIVGAAGLSLALASLSYSQVERRFTGLRHRFGSGMNAAEGRAQDAAT